MANQTKGGAAEAIGGFFKAIGGFFSGFGTAVAKGDLFVKLSLLWWGAGYARRKQYIKAVIMTALEAAVILFTIFFAMDYVPKFGSLGTVKAEKVFVIDDGNMVLEGTPKEVFPQVETLKNYGLDVPQVTETAYELKKMGISISQDILTVEEMVGAICQLKSTI